MKDLTKEELNKRRWAYERPKKTKTLAVVEKPTQFPKTSKVKFEYRTKDAIRALIEDCGGMKAVIQSLGLLPGYRVDRWVWQSRVPPVHRPAVLSLKARALAQRKELQRKEERKAKKRERERRRRVKMRSNKPIKLMEYTSLAINEERRKANIIMTARAACPNWYELTKEKRLEILREAKRQF